jgi:excinuclease ABC subunit A
MNKISVRGARQHNLQNVDLEIPRNRLTVITGLSGSGKSSLAFDTLYAEGQRRYIESLSTYARQFLEQMEKPDVDTVEGLSPAVSIEQKTTSKNIRSTVGTITEVYDYFRLLFSSIGIPHCPNCSRPITPQTVDRILERVFDLPEGSRIIVLAPVVRERKGEYRKLFDRFVKMGFLRARIDGELALLEDPPPLERRKNHTVEVVVDRLLVRKDLRERLETSIRHALRLADGLVTVAAVGGLETLFSERMACVDCEIDVPTLEPRSFSFNSRFGACRACEGLGVERHVDLSRLIENPRASLKALRVSFAGKEFDSFFRESLSALLEAFDVRLRSPFNTYPEPLLEALLNGLEAPIQYRYGDLAYQARFMGLTHWFRTKADHATSPKRRQQYLDHLVEGQCSACGGSRLKPESRAVRINGLSIDQYCRLDLTECLHAVERIELDTREEMIAGQVLAEIRNRLEFMLEVGLSYLTLDRQGASLSGGEGQRIRLATQIGSKLRGVLYVLDEPSIGMHARDTHRLLKTLKELRDLGNTIVLVEHDEETIRNADHLVDLGPGGGKHGGQVVASGTVKQIIDKNNSLTARYLSGEQKIMIPTRRTSPRGKQLVVRGVEHNNINNVDVRIPLGLFVAVTGVSGSGKSSLVDEVLYRALSRELYGSAVMPGRYRKLEGLKHIDKVIEIDQSPIGKTPRSNPATYTGLFTPIRELYSLLPEARVRGFKPGRFSFNVKGGRCEVCRGGGVRRIVMNFLPDVFVECEACRGRRYNRETLAVKFKGLDIAEVLDLTIEEVYPILKNVPQVERKLKVLLDIGLGYVKLGQPATTLSGGEAQRVKLARELSKRSSGKTIYILDEPTTGLHFHDVGKLLDILQELVNLGNTVIVIEHNLEVIKCADWVIDLGPEGGSEGGEVVVSGPPEKVARCGESHTGWALKKMI